MSLIRGVIILLVPIVFIIIVNEYSRTKVKENGYKWYKSTAINSNQKIKEKCTWACYNNTVFCKENHVKVLNPYFKITDKFYFGVIKLLETTGNYVFANIAFLVLFFPLLIWFCIERAISIEYEIRALKRRKQ